MPNFFFFSNSSLGFFFAGAPCIFMCYLYLYIYISRYIIYTYIHRIKLGSSIISYWLVQYILSRRASATHTLQNRGSCARQTDIRSIAATYLFPEVKKSRYFMWKKCSNVPNSIKDDVDCTRSKRRQAPKDRNGLRRVAHHKLNTDEVTPPH